MAVSRYLVYCETEQKTLYVLNENTPTECPNDPTHSIHNDSVRVLETYPVGLTTLAQETSLTGNSFAIETRKLTIEPHETETLDLAWNFPVNILSLFFNTEHKHSGDTLTMSVAPDTVIGAINSDTSATDNIINVTETVIGAIRPGFWLCLTDGTYTSEYLQIIGVNPVAQTVTLDGEIGYNFLATSPTYVKLTIFVMKNLEIQGPHQYRIGDVTHGSASIPTGTPVRIQYTNNSPFIKTFIGTSEYLY